MTHTAYSDLLILLRNTSNVLNPLFWDDLQSQLEAAANNGRKLLNLRQRMACICVFDSAYGAGNFPIIACNKMWVIEDEVNCRRDEVGCRSDILLANF